MQTLGADIRSLRKSRGMTLNDLASRIDMSVGWLSQVERDISVPSTADLKQIAGCLDVSLSLFFGAQPDAPEEAGRVVRADNRRVIGAPENGLREELLNPDLSDSFEMIRSVFAVGSHSDGTVQRNTEEVGYVLSGQLDLWIDGHDFTLSVGDSFRLKSQPFRWSNPYSDPAIVIWVISPPVY